MSVHLLLHLLPVMYYFPSHPQILTTLDGLIHCEIDIHVTTFHCLQLLKPHFTRRLCAYVSMWVESKINLA